MKTYTVSLLPPGQGVQFEALPVAKITHYPLEQHAYKPYAQVVLAVSDAGLAIRLSAFEVSPKPESGIGAVLYMFPDRPEVSLNIWAATCGVDTFIMEGAQPVDSEIHRREGEDLQGKYWGYDVLIGRDALSKVGRLPVLDDKEIKGNFFKTQSISPKHYGAFDLAQFKTKTNYHKEKMAIFELVDY